MCSCKLNWGVAKWIKVPEKWGGGANLLSGIYQKKSFQKNGGEGSTLSGQVPDRNGKSILMASLIDLRNINKYDSQYLTEYLKISVKHDF